MLKSLTIAAMLFVSTVGGGDYQEDAQCIVHMVEVTKSEGDLTWVDLEPLSLCK